MMGPRLARLLAVAGPVASAPLRPLLQAPPAPATHPARSAPANRAAQPAAKPTITPLEAATPLQPPKASASPTEAVAAAALTQVPPTASQEPPTRDARRSTTPREAAPPPPIGPPAQETGIEATPPELARTFETRTPYPSASASAITPGPTPASLNPVQPAPPLAEPRVSRPARATPLLQRDPLPPGASAPAAASPPMPVTPPSQQPREVPRQAPAPAVDSEPSEPHAPQADVADAAVQLTAAPSSPAGGAKAPSPESRPIAAPLQAEPATPFPTLRHAAPPSALPLPPPAPPSIRITIGRVTVVAPPEPPRSARPAVPRRVPRSHGIALGPGG